MVYDNVVDGRLCLMWREIVGDQCRGNVKFGGVPNLFVTDCTYSKLLMVVSYSDLLLQR